MSQIRAYDCLYDSTYTVSGARDHYREQSRAAGFQIERVPEYQNFFSELPTHPSQAFRFKAADKLPQHVNREYQPPQVTGQELQWKSSAARISGANRYKHFRRPLLPASSVAPPPRSASSGQVQVGVRGGIGGGGAAGASGSGAQAGPSGHAGLPANAAAMHNMEAVQTGPSAMTIGTQSDYRESEAQTQPFTPDYVIPEQMTDHQRALDEKYHLHGQPELLTIEHMKFHDGLPPGLAEVEMIEKQRAKRAFDDALPPLDDDAQMPLRRAMMEEWEEKEWADREQEIKEVQEERLEVLRRAILHREEKLEGGSAVRIDDMRAAKLADKQKAFAAIQKRRIKALRTLAQARKHVEGVPKTDIIDDYGSYSSKVYAPKTRDGRFPEMVPKGRVIDPKPFEPSSYKGMLELEATMPISEVRMKTKRPPIKEPHTAQERSKAHVASQLDHITGLLETSTNVGGRGFGDVWPCPTSGVETEVTKRKRLAAKKLDRPETPQVPEPDASVVRARAVGLLQRLLRGRAVQNSMFEGKERRLELIRELRLEEEVPHDVPMPDALPPMQRQADAMVGTAVAEALDILAVGDPVQQAELMKAVDEKRRASEAAAEARAGAMRGSGGGSATLGEDEDEGEGGDDEADDEEELTRAATRIQARHRGRRARKDVKARKKAKALPAIDEDKELDQAATRIQARHRGRKARREHQAKAVDPATMKKRADRAAEIVLGKLLEDIELEELLADPGASGAAVKIQAIQRGRKSRKEVAAMRAQGAGVRSKIMAQADDLPALDSFSEDDHKNIIKIQSAQRGRQVRRKVKVAKPSPLIQEETFNLDDYDETHVTKIQARARGHAARRQAAAKKKREEQAAYEGDEEEEEETFNLEEYDEAQITKIQARARGKATRKQMAAKQGGAPAAAAAEEEEETFNLEEYDEAQITKIQARARGKATRKQMAAKQGGAPAAAAAEEEEETFNLEEYDEAQITKIQARARGKATRKQMAAKQGGAPAAAAAEEEEEETFNLEEYDEAQITKIQARARGKATRKQMAAKQGGAPAAAAAEEEEEETFNLEEYDEAQITKIQARARGKATRKQMAAKQGGAPAAAAAEEEEETFNLEEYDEAQITKIQARARGKATRKQMAAKQGGAPAAAAAEEEEETFNLEEYDEAQITKIQARARGKATRKQMASKQGGAPAAAAAEEEEETFNLEEYDEAQITKIQARARGKATRKQMAAKQGGAPAAAAAEEEEETFNLEEYDEAQITKIQARARGKATRKQMAAKKEGGGDAAAEEEEEEEEETFNLDDYDTDQITKIQARARGKATRKQMAAKQAEQAEAGEDSPELASALGARPSRSFNRGTADETMTDEERAAIKIQSSARGMLVRKERKEITRKSKDPATEEKAAEAAATPAYVDLSPEDEEYVVKIQAGIRGHLARKEVAGMKGGAGAAEGAEAAAAEGGEGGEEVNEADAEEVRQQEEAAVKIQAASRGRIARKEVAAKKAALKEAMTEAEKGEEISADVSQFTADEQASIVKIQSVARGRAARKQVAELKAGGEGAEGAAEEGAAAAEEGAEEPAAE